MFKFLVPLLLSTTLAFAGTNQPTPPTASNKSFTVNHTYTCDKGADAFKAIISDGGYNILMVWPNINDPLEMNQLLYNKENNTLLIVLATFTDNTYKEASSVCVEGMGPNPFVNPETMRTFLLGQIMAAPKREQEKAQANREKRGHTVDPDGEM